MLGDGTLGTAYALPTVASGSQNAITMSESAGSEGALNLSADGNYLTVLGYAAAPGTLAVASTASATTRRVIARIDANGSVDTSTTLNTFTANNARGVVSDNGQHFWAAGAGSGDTPKSGIVYTTLGASSGTALFASSPTGARVPEIVNGQLYLSTTTTVTPGIYKVGTGLPTTGSQTATALTSAAAGFDPYSYALVRLASGSGAPDTLYVSDGTTGTIKKYSLISSTWTAEGATAAITGGLTGLVGKVQSGAVQLYATSADGSKVVSFVDSAGANATITAGTPTTIATAPTNTLFRGVAFAPTGQTLTPVPTVTLSDSALSRAIGDTFNPTTFTATVSGSGYTADQLTVTASSDNTAVVSAVSVAGNGTTGARTLTVTSNDAVGIANITVTVTAPNGLTSTAVLQYGVSVQAPDANTRWLNGASDASTAIDVGGGYFVVADDTSNILRLYHGGVSGLPTATWDFSQQLGGLTTAGSSSMDLEASARVGNTIYWLGSNGNASDNGALRPTRAYTFTTTITGSGAATQLSFGGYYTSLRNDLIAWDQANGNALGLAASGQSGHLPKTIDGLNVEGMEFAADGSGTMYVGFRAPLEPTASRSLALVVPVTNFTSLPNPSGTGSGQATFGAPMYWDLGGRSVREIRKNADGQYLVIGGMYDTTANFALYTWDGNPAHQPIATTTTLPSPLGSWETVISVPDPLTNGASVQFIEDDGSYDFYGSGTSTEAKTLDLGLRKARYETVNVTLAAQTVAFAAGTPTTGTSGLSFTPSATLGATGNPATFSIDPTSGSGVCSFSSGAVHFLTPGMCVVAADEAGSFQYAPAATQKQAISVTLPPAPALSLPADITAEATGSNGRHVPFSATATDIVDGTTPVSCVPVSGAAFPVGITTVHCSATDSQGVVANGTFKIAIVDTTPPALTLPGDVIREATGSSGTAASYTATATDLVDGASAVTCLPASGSTFAIGTTVVHCSTTDGSANTAQGTFSITVQDTTAPSVHVLADLTIDAAGPAGAPATFTATATDVVDGSVAVTCSPSSGSVFALGSTNVVCSATDGHGNLGQASFSVTVADVSPPSLVLPADQTAEAAGASGANVPFTATATDLVDANPAIVCDHTSGSLFSLGHTTVTCAATDGAGNTISGSFDVSVTDTTAPTITLPSDQALEATSATGATLLYNATATDLVDGALPVTCSTPSGAPAPFGFTTVTCSATDAHGNTTSASFMVAVVDTTAPTLTTPGSLTFEATSQAGATATFAFSATDAVDGALTPVCDHDSGTLFSFGITTVQCSVTDTHGNSAHRSFTIRVRDTIAPIVVVPPLVTLEANGPAGAFGTYLATATDNIDGSTSVFCLPPSGAFFASGSTTVDCAATDSHGNTAHASFSVDVRDTVAPVISGVPGAIRVAAASSAGTAVAYAAPHAVDAADGSTPVVCSRAGGSVFPVGLTTVTCSSTDHSANTSRVSFTVTVAPDHFASSGLTYGVNAFVGQPFGLTVTAYDTAGRILTTFSGSGAASDRTGTVSTTPITFTNGIATLGGTINAPSIGDVISVTDGFGTPSKTRDFAVVGPVDHFVSSGLSVGTSLAVGQSFSVTVTAYDAVGNVALAYNGTATATDTTGTVQTAPISFSNGVATVTGTVRAPSRADAISVGDGIHVSARTREFPVIGGVDHFASSGLTVTTSIQAGRSFSVTVTAYDAVGNVATGFGGSAAVTDRTGALATTSVSFSQGIATLTEAVLVPIATDWLTIGDGTHTSAQTRTFAVTR